ncbi:prefoldin subunit 3-like [Mercenaria mercenaria]|uniref:prefoldin subunit 3-like n=1 Tax=Mercenaria mercenaria TaxID=6596 RepID=UPI001E1E02B1|nr:prefoldin subunit 3-like [Mercenaria mercenaria]
MASTETNSTEIETKTYSGIPKADFLEDVDSYMKRSEETAESALKKLDEQHNKYKFMEYNLNTKKARLKAQIPDIKKTLDIIAHLQTRKNSSEPMETRFLLSDQVYAKARVPPTDKVCLWLGANVMLEYNLDDAETLLKKNQEVATKSLKQVEDELSYITEQTTTLEVNMARVYNWDVKRQQAVRASKSS